MNEAVVQAVCKSWLLQYIKIGCKKLQSTCQEPPLHRMPKARENLRVAAPNVSIVGFDTVFHHFSPSVVSAALPRVAAC